MNPDCSDIRFTYLYPNNTEVEIPYWIESGCNTANTRIWIKVPYIPANGNVTVYMYYGNPNAVSMSNGDYVFEFFDDFEGPSLNTSKWVVIEDLYGFQNGAIYFIPNNGYPWEKIRTANRLSLINKIVESREMIDANGGNTFYWLYYGTYSNTFINITYLCSGGICWGDNLNYVGTAPWQYFQLYNPSLRITDGDPVVEDVWYIKKAIILPDRIIAYINDANRIEANIVLPTEGYLIFLCEYYASAKCWVDWIRVRKYVEPEPSYLLEQSKLVFYLK
jgi:Uncharacterized conserved protein